MSKPDQDPSSPDAPQQDREAAPSQPAQPAAAAPERPRNQDLKDTEDLLAGFDRPGRAPAQPQSGDFVAYYSGGKKSAPRGRPSPAVGTTTERSSRQAATVLVPRKDKLPAWLPWVAAAALMIGIGGVVAVLATNEPSRAADAPTASVPSAATTITSALPLETSARDEVPPPPPSPSTDLNAAPPATAAPPSDTPPPARPRRTRATDPASATAAPNLFGDKKPPPRDDFIRDF